MQTERSSEGKHIDVSDDLRSRVGARAQENEHAGNQTFILGNAAGGSLPQDSYPQHAEPAHAWYLTISGDAMGSAILVPGLTTGTSRQSPVAKRQAARTRDFPVTPCPERMFLGQGLERMQGQEIRWIVRRIATIRERGLVRSGESWIAVSGQIW